MQSTNAPLLPFTAPDFCDLLDAIYRDRLAVAVRSSPAMVLQGGRVIMAKWTDRRAVTFKLDWLAGSLVLVATSAESGARLPIATPNLNGPDAVEVLEHVIREAHMLVAARFRERR